MNLYINASNREHNCYSILKDLMQKDDELVSLARKEIKYCLGCNACLKDLNQYCVQSDNMQEVYTKVEQCNDIIIATPIYFDNINGILKNVIDRFMPIYVKKSLKDKRVYLIIIGEQTEEENKIAEQRIKDYFDYLAETFEFEFVFLKNLSSSQNDNIRETYSEYSNIVLELFKKINS